MNTNQIFQGSKKQQKRKVLVRGVLGAREVHCVECKKTDRMLEWDEGNWEHQMCTHCSATSKFKVR